MAMRRGEAVALIPIVRLNFAITAILTITLINEEISFVKGGALVLAALAVLSGGSGILSSGGDRKSLVLACSAMCLFGFLGLFIKLGLRLGAAPSAMTLAQSIGVSCSALPFFFWKPDPLPHRGGALWIPLACGVLTSSSYLSLSVGFTYGDAVVIAPIAQLSFVLTGLMAILFLGERLSPRKGMGVIFAIMAVLAFFFGIIFPRIYKLARSLFFGGVCQIDLLPSLSMKRGFLLYGLREQDQSIGFQVVFRTSWGLDAASGLPPKS